MKKNLLFLKSKSAFLFIVAICLLALMVNSSFKILVKKPMSCNGPFATTNVLGSGFAIFAPGTGAPDEAGTCGRAGSSPSCHNSTDNSGPGTFTLDIGGGITQYVPGQTYTVTVGINQSGISAFDFELTNRPQSGGTLPAGTFSITDVVDIRTKLTNGNFGGGGTSYVEGTACGVDQLSTGFNQWTFNWTAPAVGVGNITFYVGMVAANFNNASTGDYTYQTSKVLTQGGGVGLNETTLQQQMQLYPNPFSRELSVEVSIERSTELEVNLYDLKGSIVARLFKDKVGAGEFKKTFERLANLEKGIYFLRAKSSEKNYSGRVIVE